MQHFRGAAISVCLIFAPSVALGQSPVKYEPSEIIYEEPAIIEPVMFSTWVGYADIESTDNAFSPTDAEQWSGNAQLDLLLFGTASLSLFVSYLDSDNDSSTAATPVVDTNGELISVGAALSYPVLNWLSLGVEGGYAKGDSDTDTVDAGMVPMKFDQDFSQYLVGAFAHATLATEYVLWSATPRVRYTEGDGDYDSTLVGDGDFDTTEAMVTLRGGIFPLERLRLDFFATPRVVISQDRPQGTTEADDFNVNLGGEATVAVLPGVAVFAGYSHDAFDSNWDNHYVTAGMRFSLWGLFD